MVGFAKAMDEHLSGGEDARTAHAALTKEVSECIARARTTKYECLLLKNFSSKTKTLEAKKDSSAKHIRDHGQSAKVPSQEWIHPAIMKESSKIQAAWAKEKEAGKKKK